jgi:hypothetical protein
MLVSFVGMFTGITLLATLNQYQGGVDRVFLVGSFGASVRTMISFLSLSRCCSHAPSNNQTNQKKLARFIPHVLDFFAVAGIKAMLVFAIPSSPLAQPYNLVFGIRVQLLKQDVGRGSNFPPFFCFPPPGNTLSAFVGVAISKIVGDDEDHVWVAAAFAAAFAVLAMEMVNARHPPGGATALLAVIGPPAVRARSVPSPAAHSIVFNDLFFHFLNHLFQVAGTTSSFRASCRHSCCSGRRC